MHRCGHAEGCPVTVKACQASYTAGSRHTFMLERLPLACPGRRNSPHASTRSQYWCRRTCPLHSARSRDVAKTALHRPLRGEADAWPSGSRWRNLVAYGHTLPNDSSPAIGQTSSFACSSTTRSSLFAAASGWSQPCPQGCDRCKTRQASTCLCSPTARPSNATRQRGVKRKFSCMTTLVSSSRSKALASTRTKSG